MLESKKKINSFTLELHDFGMILSYLQLGKYCVLLDLYKNREYRSERTRKYIYVHKMKNAHFYESN